MNGWEIAILVVVCVAFVAAVTFIIINKIKGKSGCDCGGNCSACSGCASAVKSEQTAEQTAEQTPEQSAEPKCPHCK